MIERIEPEIIKLPDRISDISGISTSNSVAVLNRKGEIAVLGFDNKLRASLRVIAPNFPGYWGKLESDPEYNLVWLRRGSGNYFIDLETGKTGHTVSMFPGSSVEQVFPSEPEKKKWFIVYGATAANKIDFYDLETDTQTTFNGVLEANLFRFSENKILAHLTTGEIEWRFSDTELSMPLPSEAFELTKKMTEYTIFLQHDIKPYNLKSNAMFGYTMDLNSFTNFFIKWDEDYKTSINPFSPLQIPDDVQGLGGIGEFSPDGQWFDMSARLNFNGFGNPDERFVYYVNERYPIGISPPVRLGLTSLRTPGGFMMHDTLGPCYILLDEEDSQLVLVFKLHDGLPIIARQLQSYLKLL